MAQRAADAGLKAIALTDHDTTAGLEECRAAAESHGIEFLNGVEVSAHFGKQEIHILGLGIRMNDPDLESLISDIREKRLRRANLIIAKLNEIGIDVSLSTDSYGEVLGRPHIAQAIVDAGHASNPQEAFDKFIGKGKPAFIAKGGPGVANAIDAIHGAGGLAFIAHPGLGNLEHSLAQLLTHPFDGIEAYHSKHSPGKTDGFVQIAAERNLLTCGGSDCHGGTNGPLLIGTVHVPYRVYEEIQEALTERQ